MSQPFVMPYFRRADIQVLGQFPNAEEERRGAACNGSAKHKPVLLSAPRRVEARRETGDRSVSVWVARTDTTLAAAPADMNTRAIISATLIRMNKECYSEPRIFCDDGG